MHSDEKSFDITTHGELTKKEKAGIPIIMGDTTFSEKLLQDCWKYFLLIINGFNCISLADKLQL